jgi:hypothetical protein
MKTFASNTLHHLSITALALVCGCALFGNTKHDPDKEHTPQAPPEVSFPEAEAMLPSLATQWAPTIGNPPPDGAPHVPPRPRVEDGAP